MNEGVGGWKKGEMRKGQRSCRGEGRRESEKGSGGEGG
jgi:hypothetical protein